ncbi:AAA family ATPase [Amycolatopsis sp. CA-230715]|uniref:AAA family ATPase n=1 Tax=Amycolatopsis sp. CA-230715 TaxID=2745196 RepID=UPI001C03127C|nr:AAA family ATPase [Amycolatopsis sp. CA-230715]QWF78885.1 hypothetical protein HUW46_02284 [Amycolatopsis sp. CA-230715]
MRDTMRAEVVQISEGVARDLLGQSSLLWAVEREIQTRLPSILHQHALTLLPNLAKSAVSEATPDRRDVEAAAEGVVRRRVETALPELISRASADLLPGLAEDAVRDAAPDAAKLREDVVAAANAELAEVVRRRAAEVLANVVGQATEKVRAAVSGTVERESARLLPNLADVAVAAATPDRTEIRDELVREALALVTRSVREAAESAAPRAVEAAAKEVRGSLVDAVGTAASEVLPRLAGEAVAEAADGVRQLHQRLVDEAAATVTGEVRDAIRDDIPVAAKRVSEEAMTVVRDAVREEAEEVFAQYAPNVVKVVLPQGKEVELGADAHAVLPELLVALHARCHVLLVGPAGTGKSMLAKHAAEALGLGFQALSLGPTTPMSKVFGYYDAHGQYHETPFRHAFEHGGVMLLDELDNGHPGLLAELNQALALGSCAFADGMVDAHPDFRLVATGNTYGTGGDRLYVGRQTLDSATLDRFVVLDVPIDEALEERIALRHAPSKPDEVRELLDEVRRLRELAEDKKLPLIFSPRASIDGAKLLEAGATREQVRQWRVLRGVSEAHRKSLDLG